RAGVSVDEYEEYAGGTKLFTIEENLEAFTPGDTMKSLYYSAEQMNKFLVDVGLASQEADLSNIFDDRFVKAYAEKKG
ncbi:MAG: aliphatic sulfonates ABC transporter substrate-binding protein, partial [Cyanobacteria bacterium J149]